MGGVMLLLKFAPKTVIIDEAHNFVNSKSKTYPLVERITKACGKRVLLLTCNTTGQQSLTIFGVCVILISIDILGTKKCVC